ncbi:copper resistance CopC family protein [Bacillus sp. JJ1562]|uniref:copper resistance CopC family protein n=1 Tax=Bacillus sp. JJ1562 TaxID=3122960 RepID=UPI0030017D8A
MKRIITALTAILLALTISNSVFAHSHLQESNPADGEIITEPITEIVLEFDGKIEQGSFIEVTTTSGQVVEIQDIIIGEGILTGTVSEPLANDDYQVNWNIMSADGHQLDGEFSFTVNAPDVETEEEVAEEPSETPEAVEDTTDGEKQSTESQDEVSSDEAKEESSFMTVILIVLLIVIIAGGLTLLIKKRK